ncbi:MAG: choice-of-anchor J domain-containing protein [Flavobacteriales bacterium]|nr:choice-of-anchor J domain-containing protein [Flavobacteriales bacterium]MCB9449403.1 choice-of-anchor J domain-containing protein [Flavobacteriales bacterium]
MKQLLTFVALLLIPGSFTYLHAQENPSPEPCLTHVMQKEEEAKDPSIAIKRAELERFTQAFVEQRKQAATGKTSGAVKIIPVVVHVIHEGGAENISDAQIQDGIRVLNEDFRRLNNDTNKTQSVWKSIAADSEIEFRLAQKDPNGNCTNGITRTYSELTNEARNNVKGLIVWPANKYLNVWLVKTIENTSGTSGFIIGFAQFPGGNSSTDGVVVRNDYWGVMGTASQTYRGRTATHEVGHWLNLRHIWGDATCGNDQVSDTPTQEASNSGCPSFPHVTCSNGPNGDMYQNYMDYSNGNCENLFTEGQKARMLATLNSSTSGRNNLWSSSNLAATGTDGTPATLCTPHAEFESSTIYLCEGDSVQFFDKSWNGKPSSWNWTFSGGTPASSTDSTPYVTYNTAGTYNVSLTASNSTGSDVELKTNYIVVSPATAVEKVMPFTEGFEDATYVSNNWVIENPDASIGWERTSATSYSGSACLRLRNDLNATNHKDRIISPTYDIDSILSPKLTYKVAFAQNTSSDNDKLKVYVSTNCGKSWALRSQKSGTQLATVSAQSFEFTPSGTSDWREETVSLGPYAGADKIRVMFEFTGDGGNNIYLDDLNLSGTGYIGIGEQDADAIGMRLYPNPFSDEATLQFHLTHRSAVDINVYDVTGRALYTLQPSALLSAGTHTYALSAKLFPKGIYFIHVNTGDHVATTRMVIQ